MGALFVFALIKNYTEIVEQKLEKSPEPVPLSLSLCVEAFLRLKMKGCETVAHSTWSTKQLFN